jgi:hypothetical protein
MPRSNEGMRLIFSAVVGVMLGYLFGISFPTVNITKLHFPSSIISYIEDRNSGITTQTLLNHAWASANNHKKNNSDSNSDEIPKIYVPTNPKGAERLPPGIVVSETDLYPRRLWGDPSEVGSCYCCNCSFCLQLKVFLDPFHMIYIPKIYLFIRTLLASQGTLLLLLLGSGKRQILMQP